MNMETSPERRVVLVTGASRGIGRAAALQLSGEDTHVVALARSVGALEGLDDEARAAGFPVTMIPLDLSDSKAIDRLAEALLSRFARLDGLFAAAGVLGPLSPLQTVSPFAFENTMRVNLFANWRLIRSLDPLLRAAPHGRCLFVTSGAAPRPRAYWGVYAASKAALEAMVMSYADETRHETIGVNLFDPGPTRTAMRAEAMPGEDPGLLPHPEEVAAEAIGYLSPACTAHGARFAFSGAT